ncbi:amidohydrolase family protein [Salegentibacter sp. F14]
MRITYLFIFVFICSLSTGLAQQTPAPKQTETISIVGATAHIGNGQVIENSILIFEEGKITAIGSQDQIEPEGELIRAEGKHLYPGFIAANATLGLVEVDAVRATDDEEELGTMLPHIRSLIAYNAESKLIESMRPNGVLMGQITPRGGRISGTSSIMQFDAWNWEDAVVKEDDAIHINWPGSFTRGRWWAGEDPGIKPSEEYQSRLRDLTDFFNSSRAYLQGERKVKHLPYLAMESVFNGDKKVFVHVDGQREIQDVIQFKKDQNLEELVIVGGYNAHKLSDKLKENDIPVLITRVHSRPENEDDDYDLPYKLATLLHKEGVLVGLQSSGQMERMNTRNLPFYAGTTVAYGMDKEDALSLITSNVAEILGIADFAGSLEEGKDATLFISQGDALDMRGNIIEKAFIQGRDISLESHQTELYNRYMNKYERQGK